jgi:hypothetical protein
MSGPKKINHAVEALSHKALEAVEGDAHSWEMQLLPKRSKMRTLCLSVYAQDGMVELMETRDAILREVFLRWQR